MSRVTVSLKARQQLASGLQLLIWKPYNKAQKFCQSLTPMKETGKITELMKEKVTFGLCI
jgi:hypothetical protein